MNYCDTEREESVTIILPHRVLQEMERVYQQMDENTICPCQKNQLTSMKSPMDILAKALEGQFRQLI